MKGKTLFEKVQFFITIFGFISSIFLYVFIIGKDTQSNASTVQNNTKSIDKVDEQIVEMKKQDINLSERLLKLTIESLIQRKELDTNLIEIKEIKGNQVLVEKQLVEINKNIDFTNYLQNKFINEDFKSFKEEIREYIKRDK